MKAIFHTATKFEAKCILDHYHMEKFLVREKWIKGVYISPNSEFLLCISGIGKLSTLNAVSKLKEFCSELRESGTKWINLGIAGTNHPAISIGTLAIVDTIQHKDSKISLTLHRENNQKLPRVPLATVDEAVSSNNNSQSNADPMLSKASLFDMEAFHFFAELNRQFPNVPINRYCLKFVSDYADGEKIDFHKLATRYDTAIQSWLTTFSVFSEENG